MHRGLTYLVALRSLHPSKQASNTKRTRQLLCLADIRAVLGDKEGKLSQEEVMQRVEDLARENLKMKSLLSITLGNYQTFPDDLVLELKKEASCG